MGISPTELMLVFLVVLLFFGAKRIPEIARSLGKASGEFKKAKDDLIKESSEMMDAAESATVEKKEEQQG